MSILKNKIRRLIDKHSRTNWPAILDAIGVAVDLGHYIGKLEIRYQNKCQRAGDLRREKFDLQRRLDQLTINNETLAARLAAADSRAQMSQHFMSLTCHSAEPNNESSPT